MLFASNESSLSIDKIRITFNCREMESFKDFQTIIVDVCCGKNNPYSHQTTTKRININKHMPFGQLLKDIKLLTFHCEQIVISDSYFQSNMKMNTYLTIYSVFEQLIDQRKNCCDAQNVIFIFHFKMFIVQIILVPNLNTFQFIKHDTLPTDDDIFYHCFASNLENEQGQEITKTIKEKKNYQMLLFCKKTLSKLL
ncbi:hypothetical protein RFI_35570 [Reticulomyxa filosa]|uniref:Uncharacterized protein n=1 Tax=Reticulomyxa filosa TaxID=46433 RepID=X6LIX7_RETFI|nr:hypothetical protein RFI_35570 [Reticulomyxa filosa]|eukprot:ETO01868.1 hypothetical protein RFI_35570 [Reticulomyxa filosa]